MAPECIRHEPYNEKVDVYSYAVVLWELFSCEIPFVGMTPIQAAFAVADKDLRPTAVSQYARSATIPRAWMALISHCWHPSPHERPRFSEILGVLDEMECCDPGEVPAFWATWDRRMALNRRASQMRWKSRFLPPASSPRNIPGSDSDDSNSIGGGMGQALSPLGKLAPLRGALRGVHTGLGHSGSAPNLRAVASSQ